MLEESVWVAQTLVPSVLQIHLDDMVFMNPLLNESLSEEIKKEERLSATTNTGNDLDHSVSIGVQQQIQIMFSFK